MPGIIFLAVAGLLLFVGWGIFGGINFLLVLVSAIIGGICISSKFTTVESGVEDSEIDAQRQFLSNEEAVNKALNKFGLDIDQFQEIDPIIISGPYFNDIISYTRFQRGKDGKVRPSNSEITVFLFSAEQVFKYNCRRSLVKSDEISESTDEYFYRDIVTVSTETESKEFKSGTKKVPLGNNQFREEDVMDKLSFETFVMATTGGTRISCAVRTVDDTLQRSINAMRQLLREKKSVHN